jgi:membrane-associated phospholipid phosphatase
VRGVRAAKAVTEVCSPAVVVFLLPIAVAWQATAYRLLPTLGWGLVVAVFTSVLPMVFIVRGARRGRWDGHHVRDREHRFLPLVVALGSGAVGLVALLAGHAPRDVIALACSMLVTLAVCILITRWWKVSLHTTVAGGAAATITLLYGPAWLASFLLVALIGWSRVVLTDHTVAQVIAGALLGPVSGGAVFLLLR